MVRFRTFRNTDPPHIVSIWRSCLRQPGLMHPVTVDLFEQYVFGKLYFDYGGLVLALDDDDRPIGFAHAGFGPNEAHNDTSPTTGVTCIIAVRPDIDDTPTVAVGLLEQCEAYMVGRGAKTLFGGEIRPTAPFYLGLYGGAESPGILDTDVATHQLFAAAGYEKSIHSSLYHRDLTDFRPVTDRVQIQLRRKTNIAVTMDPPTAHWWEACLLGDFDLTRWEISMRGASEPLGALVLRNMQSTDPARPGLGVGIMDIEIAEEHRRQGMATLLLGEAFRQLMSEGVTRVEGHANQENAALMGLYAKLGLQLSGEATVFRKDV